MSQINFIIRPQNFELIRDRIGEITIDEMANQAAMSYDEDIDCGVSIERSMPYDKEEVPVINISFVRGDYNKKEARQVEGIYQYNIDVFHKSPTIGEVGGDTLSAKKLHKVMGLLRYIFENPIYKTLGFEPGFVGRVWFTEIGIADLKEHQDAVNTSMGRLVLNVLTSEQSDLKNPKLIAGYETTVKIGTTDNGYFYKWGY